MIEGEKRGGERSRGTEMGREKESVEGKDRDGGEMDGWGELAERWRIVLPTSIAVFPSVIISFSPSLSPGITVLLSLTVFMLLVAEIMPATSDSIPLIGK